MVDPKISNAASKVLPQFVQNYWNALPSPQRAAAAAAQSTAASAARQTLDMGTFNQLEEMRAYATDPIGLKAIQFAYSNPMIGLPLLSGIAGAQGWGRTSMTRLAEATREGIQKLSMEPGAPGHEQAFEMVFGNPSARWGAFQVAPEVDPAIAANRRQRANVRQDSKADEPRAGQGFAPAPSPPHFQFSQPGEFLARDSEAWLHGTSGFTRSISRRRHGKRRSSKSKARKNRRRRRRNAR